MRAVQDKLGVKAAEQLAVITDSHPKSAAKAFRRRSPSAPNGSAVLAIVRHSIAGIAFIQEATRNLPPEDYRTYWIRMAVAVGDALRDKDERL